MGRSPCCDKDRVRKGAWTPEEDRILVNYIMKNGHGTWRALPKRAGLQRCGKSCRLRWINYLRPDIKRGPFSPEEEATIIRLHQMLGNRWSTIASQLPGRTDNEIKNFWNTHLKKRASYVSHNIQFQGNLTSSKDTAQSETSSSHVQMNGEDIEVETGVSMKSSPYDSFVDDKTGFLKWLFDSDVDESIGNLSNGDMDEHFSGELKTARNAFTSSPSSSERIDSSSGPVVQGNDGSSTFREGLKDRKKDNEETYTKSALSVSSNIEDSSGSLGAVFQTKYVENHDSKSDVLVQATHTGSIFQSGDQDREEVIENMFSRSTSSLACDLEDYLQSDLRFLLDFPFGTDMGFSMGWEQ